jgi:hypothetical protein
MLVKTAKIVILIGMVAVGNLIDALVSSPAECCEDAGGEPVLMRQNRHLGGKKRFTL